MDRVMTTSLRFYTSVSFLAFVLIYNDFNETSFFSSCKMFLRHGNI